MIDNDRFVLLLVFFLLDRKNGTMRQSSVFKENNIEIFYEKIVMIRVRVRVHDIIIRCDK